ncbi:MAG: Aspartyl/glutamyl-tRNA(Asn/Gln) amidotransferase subunit B [candidate division TM6 bacterium GW2011_GWE2_41_16]|nr:MAG: Aspartyl/glutamyl-tRNA(Asn/Gln) amidotransferase subunit B [candidate division TM6 bacterium GW2011_GWE2_41_16]
MSSESVLERYPQYEVCIGMEVHAQLTTRSKIFCACSNAVVVEPNSTICPVCAGHPGVLPRLNQQVVEYAVMTALATHSQINMTNTFSRKHYFYPDLPKGFQITQGDLPICEHGYVEIMGDSGVAKKIRLVRIHMEEDAGKNIHDATCGRSLVDLNRAGTPLLEIVSQPDLSSAAEVRAYLKALRNTVMYLGVCSGNMEDGAFRADTNISVRLKGAEKLGTKVELKNINSFKFISDAIEYEVERQIQLIESGERVIQQTRLWDSKERKSYPMRNKEVAADYRYMPEPDLPPVCLTSEFVNDIAARLPELPEQRFARYTTVHGLSVYEAEILVNDTTIAAYYEDTYKIIKSPLLINWVLRDVMGLCKELSIEPMALKFTPRHLAELIELIESGKINSKIAQDIFKAVVATGESPREYAQKNNLEQIDDSAVLEKIVMEIIAANPSQVLAYRSGQTKLMGFFVGQMMAKTGGKGNGQKIQELLKTHLHV